MPYQRIATEEAFATPELFALYRQMLTNKTIQDPGFLSLWGFYLSSPSARATQIIERLQDLGERRIGDMDSTGVAMHILSLTSPGVQVFDAATAVAFAKSSNDQLAEAVRKHPARFVGLAAVAPQNPPEAAKELERGVRTLGLKGAIINSHTLGEYLDDPRFWDIFAAAEALDVPVYLHPNSPSAGLIQPLLQRGLDGAIYGFGVDTGMHLLSIITSGVFDRFPKLKVIVGHLGEALPFWLFRLDYMHRATVNSKRYAVLKPLQRKISDYMRENVYVTSSGMAWAPAIQFCQQVLGADRVMYAMDYPYQFEASEVTEMDAVGTDLDRRKFYEVNARAVFKL
ncbi:MAG TPA: amidohydrolase family protein [Steroidobacteraceae bacterium]|jgi:2,3-dihydroxybenzoate decarboxylase|nr:amidohydrolase family protein [Steroidobacteraceae bacterium]